MIMQSDDAGLQNSASVASTLQLTHHEEHTEVGKEVRIALEPTSTNHPHLLSMLLLKLARLLSFFVAPLDYFETWSSFQPEKYTIYDIGPNIICYTSLLADKHSTSTTASQDIFVAKTQRHWIRVRLNLTVAVGTAHWRVAVDNKQTSYIGQRQLPNNVASVLQQVMSEYPEVDDDTQINIDVNTHLDGEVCNSQPKATSLTRMLKTGDAENTLKIPESLRHQNVRMIADNELVTAWVQGVCLVANLDNRWVAYRAATASEFGISLLWSVVQANIALRDVPHVAQFVGVMVDTKKNLLKGMLVELPSKGPMFKLMDAYRFNSESVPWARRQKWAKQIVRGVAAYHERRQVIAGLRTYSLSVCIDDCDDAIIVGFSHGSHPIVHGDNGLLPPEYRTETFAKGDGKVGPEFDIFQLGLLLWHLYRDQHQQGHKTFCSLAGCPNSELASCSKHQNPVALPKASADVPDYLDQIITLCRQEDPRKRPAAWQLINMFPDDEEILNQNTLLKADTGKTCRSFTRLEAVRDVYCHIIICSTCRERARDVYYKCEVCDRGNWDICDECFVKGKHCPDTTHLITRISLEATNRGSLHQATYFSSVDEKGEREEVVI
jgi:hypothetical protein